MKTLVIVLAWIGGTLVSITVILVLIVALSAWAMRRRCDGCGEALPPRAEGLCESCERE